MSTPQWMHRREDPHAPVRTGLPLTSVIIWISALIAVGLGALAYQQTFG